MTALEKHQPQQGKTHLAVSSAAGGLAFENMSQVVAFGKQMSESAIAIPKHLRDNAGACTAVCLQAVEWKMSPFAVANKSYSVNDRLAYEAQLIHAVILSRAPIHGRPKITYTGEGLKRRCTVEFALADGSGETVSYTSPEIGQIPTKNSPLWKSDPDQQLFYFSARSCARRHFPDVIMGVYAKDELEDATPIRDVTPAPSGLRERLEASRQAQAKPEGFMASHGPQIGQEAITVVDAEYIEKMEKIVETDGEIIEAMELDAAEAQIIADIKAPEPDPYFPAEETDAAPRIGSDVFTAYHKALIRFDTKEKLKKAAAEFWAMNGDWPPENPDDVALGKAIFADHVHRVEGRISVEDTTAHVAELIEFGA